MKTGKYLLSSSHDDVLSGGDGDDILLGDGYFTTATDITLDTLPSFSFAFAGGESGGYYSGYTTQNFTLHNDAPNGGDDILFGGVGRDMLFGGTSSDYLEGGDGQNRYIFAPDDVINGVGIIFPAAESRKNQHISQQ